MAEEILRLPPDKVKALIKQGEMGIVSAPIVESRRGGNDLVEFSKKLFERDFLGPEAVEKTFGFSPRPEEVPPIQFTHQELDDAKNNGEVLILRVPRAADRSPLTIQKMQEILQPALDLANRGNVLLSTDWYENEDFFTQERPRPGWALVAKKPIEASKGKNFLEQSIALADYLESTAYRNNSVHEPLANAVQELLREKQAIADILGSREPASAKLAQLSINELTRQTASEAIYDLMMYFQNNNERLMQREYTWTNSRASDGDLVYVGRFDSDGVNVYGSSPDDSYSDLGVCPSR